MKTNSRFRPFRLALFIALLVPVGMSMSCMTTYDAYGRPMQTVDPGLAVAGVAAAGLIGYAAANNNNHRDHGYYHGGGYYRSGGYHRGGRYYR